MSDDYSANAITPETTLEDLLGAHPQLEELLEGLSPAVRALTSPALRGAVWKITTLRQVANAAKVPIGELIGNLRCAAGLEAEDLGGDRPAWASASAVVRRLDARMIIQSGGHPLAQVMSDLATLEPGQVYELVTPFVPAPLIEIAVGRGFQAFSKREASDLVRTWFAKK